MKCNSLELFLTQMNSQKGSVQLWITMLKEPLLNYYNEGTLIVTNETKLNCNRSVNVLI